MAVALRRFRSRQARAGGRTPQRPRMSILVEFLGALVSVVLISAAGTGILQDRLTNSMLERETERLAGRRADVVLAAYEGQEETLGATIRYLAEVLNVNRATASTQHADLVRELSRTGSALDLDVLAVFGREGRFLFGEGRYLEGSDLVAGAAPGSPSRIVRDPSGESALRVWSTPIGVNGEVLVAGQEINDYTAVQLRDALGDVGQVILVAGGKVAGTSISLPEGRPPGGGSRGRLPEQPVKVTLGGEEVLLVYRTLDDSLPGETAAVGVAVPDPVAGLTDRLTLVRLVSTLVLAGVALVTGWLLFWTLIRPLVDISRTASRIATGDLNATFAAPRNNEIGRLASALQKMTSELRGQNRRLQEASKRLLVAQQDERQRVARDLHDGMQQQLVVLAVKIKQLAASEDPPNPLILEHLAAEAEEAAFALQDLGRGIYPTVLGDQGVPAALRTSASRLPMKVRLEVDPELEERRLSPEIEGTLYFVALEAMANAQKHAPDAELRITLSRGPGDVRLEVSDDGPGFDPAVESMGAGLQNIADRVSAVGGSASIAGSPGGGVTVRISVPIDAGTVS